MEKQSILEVIEERLLGMSKSQKKIGTFVLNHLDRAAFMTASALGRETGVSESTVVRFAKDLGMTGYPQMQGALAQCLRDRLSGTEKVTDAVYGRSQSEILSSVMTSDAEALRDTMQNLDLAAFDEVTDRIAKAECVYVCGLRGNEPLARFFHSHLCRIRKNVTLLTTTSASEIFEKMLYLESGDCFVCIQFPEYSALAVKAMEYAKKQGAGSVLITDREEAIGMEFADCHLIARCEKISIVNSLTAAVSLMNALCIALALKNPGQARANVERLEQTWRECQIFWNQEDKSEEE